MFTIWSHRRLSRALLIMDHLCFSKSIQKYFFPARGQHYRAARLESLTTPVGTDVRTQQYEIRRAAVYIPHNFFKAPTLYPSLTRFQPIHCARSIEPYVIEIPCGHLPILYEMAQAMYTHIHPTDSTSDFVLHPRPYI